MENSKRVYHKPEISHVKLVPEEAVLGGCKTSGEQLVDVQSNNPNCGIGSTQCFLDGS
jgi:hypothetical protein